MNFGQSSFEPKLGPETVHQTSSGASVSLLGPEIMRQTSSSVSVARSEPFAHHFDSPLPETAGTGQVGPKSMTAFQQYLLTKLDIPEHLTVRSTGSSLAFAYQKYVTYLDAFQTYDGMVAAGTWVGRKPTKIDIITIFTSRTMWHSEYRPLFSQVHKYPTLVEWLEGGPASPSNLEAWGVEKATYTFKDLRIFLNNGGTLEGVDMAEEKKEKKNKKGKEKQKQKGSEKEEKKSKKKSSRKAE